MLSPSGARRKCAHESHTTHALTSLELDASRLVSTVVCRTQPNARAFDVRRPRRDHAAGALGAGDAGGSGGRDSRIGGRCQKPQRPCTASQRHPGAQSPGLGRIAQGSGFAGRRPRRANHRGRPHRLVPARPGGPRHQPGGMAHPSPMAAGLQSGAAPVPGLVHFSAPSARRLCLHRTDE